MRCPDRSSASGISFVLPRSCLCLSMFLIVLSLLYARLTCICRRAVLSLVSCQPRLFLYVGACPRLLAEVLVWPVLRVRCAECARVRGLEFRNLLCSVVSYALWTHGIRVSGFLVALCPLCLLVLSVSVLCYWPPCGSFASWHAWPLVARFVPKFPLCPLVPFAPVCPVML